MFLTPTTPDDAEVLIGNTVFLTRAGIWQMPTWLRTWKTKSLYHVVAFLPTWFFLPLQKFKTIKYNRKKIPIPKQIRACYIFQGMLKIFSNIYASLFIFSKLLKNWESAIVFINRRCLPGFFSIDIKFHQFRGHPFMTSTKNDPIFDPPPLPPTSTKMNSRSIV